MVEGLLCIELDYQEVEENKMNNLTNLKKIDFDQETINDFKQIINDGLAYGVFLYDWAIQKEIENHLSGLLFQDPPHMLETTLKLLSFYIKRAKTKSIIGFTEGPAGAIPVTIAVAQRMDMPSYEYNMEDEGSFSQFIEPAYLPCSLILPYSSNDIQVNEIIQRFYNQGPKITQVISLVEEQPVKTDFSEHGIEYVSLANWDSIRNRIQDFKNLTPQKTEELQSFFEN